MNAVSSFPFLILISHIHDKGFCQTDSSETVMKFNFTVVDVLEQKEMKTLAHKTSLTLMSIMHDVLLLKLWFKLLYKSCKLLCSLVVSVQTVLKANYILQNLYNHFVVLLWLSSEIIWLVRQEFPLEGINSLIFMQFLHFYSLLPHFFSLWALFHSNIKFCISMENKTYISLLILQNNKKIGINMTNIFSGPHSCYQDWKMESPHTSDILLIPPLMCFHSSIQPAVQQSSAEKSMNFCLLATAKLVRCFCF